MIEKFSLNYDSNLKLLEDLSNQEEYDLNEEEIATTGKRVRAIIGVPEPILTNEIISSPIFKKQTENFINKRIKEYLENIDEEDLGLLEVASMYYLSYLLCVGMDARLPKQMENLSTKTVLNSINWDEKALELLDKANELIDDFLAEFDVDEGYNTFADLSDEVEYPETNI